MRLVRQARPLVVMALAMAAAGCGSDSNKTDGARTANTDTTVISTTSTASPTTTTVTAAPTTSSPTPPNTTSTTQSNYCVATVGQISRTAASLDLTLGVRSDQASAQWSFEAVDSKGNTSGSGAAAFLSDANGSGSTLVRLAPDTPAGKVTIHVRFSQPAIVQCTAEASVEAYRTADPLAP
jgi:hypothetical protein